MSKARHPVVFVNGNVESNSFYLPKPIDAGAFDYDLFFVPTGSGYFELRSLPGGGSHHLPELVTSMQDEVPDRHRDMARPHRRSARAAEWRRSVR